MLSDSSDSTPEGLTLPESQPSTATPLSASARPAPEPWSWRDLIYFLAFGVAWLWCSAFFTAAVYAGLKPLFGWRTPLQAIQSNAFVAVISQTVFYVPLLSFIYFLVVKRYQLGFWAAFNRGRVTLHHGVRSLLGGVLLALVAVSSPVLLPDRDTFPLQQYFSSPGAAYAIAGFAVLVAPIMEEVIFRGVLYNVFERRLGVGLAIALSATLFAGFHVPEYWGAWNHLLLVSLAGVIFSLARALTGSLAPSVILHFGYNATLMTGLFLTTHQFRAL